VNPEFRIPNPDPAYWSRQLKTASDIAIKWMTKPDARLMHPEAIAARSATRAAHCARIMIALKIAGRDDSQAESLRALIESERS